MTLHQFTRILCLSPVSQTAGLHPTAEQIEMFAYHLPDATLSNLVVSIIDGKTFQENYSF